MKLFRQVLFGLICGFSLQYVFSGTFVVYKTKSIECNANSEYIVNVSCTVVAINWFTSYINTDCYLVKPLNNTMIRGTFYRRDDTHQFKPFMFGFNFSICHENSKYLLLPHANDIIQHLRTYTNINHSCPYSGHMFARKVMYRVDETFPDFPLGEYKLVFRFYENSIEIGSVKCVVEAMQRRRNMINKKTA